jgi:hypothetical protein
MSVCRGMLLPLTFHPQALIFHCLVLSVLGVFVMELRNVECDTISVAPRCGAHQAS